ncbi:hypothetical protein ACOMHN_008999 [Nucella lapillus]
MDVSKANCNMSRSEYRGHSVGWHAPGPTPDLFLERLECANSDLVNLAMYSQGLPIMCQFGRGNSSHLCAVTDENGQVSFFDTRPPPAGYGIPRVHSWQAHNNAAFDFAWINDDSQCLTASGDQMVALWDVATTTRVTTFTGHSCSVRSIAPCPGSPAQFVSGARDGHIMLWDHRVNKKANGTNLPERSIKYAHGLATRANLRRHRRIHRSAGLKGVIVWTASNFSFLFLSSLQTKDTQQSVTCVLYQTDNVIISSGANDGCVKFWDTRKWYSNSFTSLPQPLHTFHYPGHMRRLKGIVTMCMDPWRSQLFVSYTDGKVCRFELAGNYREPTEFVYAGHRNDTFYMRCCVSPDGRYLLSGSGRNTGVIWEVGRPEKRPVFLIGHREDVSAVDWCPSDACKLATLSDDMSLRIWRPDTREPDTEDPSILGFAFSAGVGKVCRRKSQVHIVQDEFPFSLPVPNGASASSPAQPLSPARSPGPRRWQEPSMRQVFWASCQTLRRSPRKLTKDTPTPTPASPLAGRGSKQPPASPRGKGGRKREQVGEEGHPELRGRSPQPSTSCDSVDSSPRTPKNASSLLPFGSYALRSSVRDSASSPGSVDTEQSPLLGTPRKHAINQDELSGIEAASPRARSCKSPHRAVSSPRRARTSSPGVHSAHGCRRKGLTPMKSPKKLLTPTKSPHKCVRSTPASAKPRRQLFSSPTASLPNRVLDPPSKSSTPPSTPPHRTVDWLTRYRMSRLEMMTLSKQEASPGGSSPSPGALGKESPASGKKGDSSGRKSTSSKRRLSGALEQEEEEGMSGKRKRVDRTPTPRSARRRRSSSFSKAGSSSSSQTPSRRSTESPKTPTNMCIKRYLQ